MASGTKWKSRLNYKRRDFCKRIHLNQPVFGKVREFLVAAKNGALLERINQMLAKRNVDLDIVPTGQGAHISEIEHSCWRVRDDLHGQT